MAPTKSPLTTLLLTILALLATTVTAKCPKGAHIIATRGHPPQGSNQPPGGYGITLPLLKALKQAIPHSTNESIAYPKDARADEENMIGVKHIKAAIAKSVKACPKTPIVLYGYSNGAFILSDAICGTSNALLTPTTPLAKKYSKNVIASILYSDGSYAPNADWSKGTCKTPGKFARTNNDDCDPFAKSLIAYCEKTDGYCCGFGDDHSSHYTYFKKYDKTVAKFAKKRFNAFKK